MKMGKEIQMILKTTVLLIHFMKVKDHVLNMLTLSHYAFPGKPRRRTQNGAGQKTDENKKEGKKGKTRRGKEEMRREEREIYTEK